MCQAKKITNPHSTLELHSYFHQISIIQTLFFSFWSLSVWSHQFGELKVYQLPKHVFQLTVWKNNFIYYPSFFKKNNEIPMKFLSFSQVATVCTEKFWLRAEIRILLTPEVVEMNPVLPILHAEHLNRHQQNFLVTYTGCDTY